MPLTVTARIVEWNSDKAYGFLKAGKIRVFLHVKDFAEKRKVPEVGDKVRFVMGDDAQGRPCAMHAVHLENGGQFGLSQLIKLGILLFFPLVALFRWNPGPLGRMFPEIPEPFLSAILPAYAAAISLLTFFIYRVDKMRARKRTWRVAESRLHLLELLGGWPGAFFAQSYFRHKTSKQAFQFIFWLIVLVYQLVALNFLTQGKIVHLIRDLLAFF